MKSKKMIIIPLVIGLILIFGAFYLGWLYFFGTVNPPLPQDTITIGNNTWTVELATTMLEQARGLSGRDSLGQNDGMLFLFNKPSTQYFWMIGMKFPLDMIWIGGGKVLGFAANDPAPAPGTPTATLPIYSSPDGVDQVLEVNAGTVAKYGIKVGDPVIFK